jgi:hypothetical protein
MNMSRRYVKLRGNLSEVRTQELHRPTQFPYKTSENEVTCMYYYLANIFMTIVHHFPASHERVMYLT